MKTSLFCTIAIIIGLVISSAASLPVSKSTGETNELTVTMSNKVAEKLARPVVKLETPLQTVPHPLSNPAFAYVGDQIHPAFGRAGSIHMAAYKDADVGEIIWAYSVDDGASYDPGIYWEGLGGDYPSIKLWEGERFFGTFVTDPLDLDGGITYLYEINDVTQLENNTLNHLTYNNWSSYGWYDMIDADIACDSSQESWEWGVSSYVISTTYGDGYTDGPTITYADENTQGSVWISWYYYDGCDHTDVDIDHSTIYSYAVYDWEDTTAGYYKLLCRVNDFSEIMNGYDTMYELDYGYNLQRPAVAAGDGNIVILAETDASGNKDIICFYGPNLSSMSTSFVVNTTLDEMYPDVRYVEGDIFICTYVKGNNLYAVKTDDAGVTWTEDRWQINDNNGYVVEEYKTSDLCEKAKMVMWEENHDDIDIYIGLLEKNSKPQIPNINGPSIGISDTDYNYSVTTSDPDNDSIYYYIDWGDGNYSGWLGPYESGEEISASHSWNEGTYEVRVKAKDVHGYESNWSESLIVNIVNLQTVFMFGSISNFDDTSEIYSFNANLLIWISFNPLDPQLYSSGETILISDKYLAMLRNSFLLGFFNAAVV